FTHDYREVFYKHGTTDWTKFPKTRQNLKCRFDSARRARNSQFSDLRERKRDTYGHLFDDADAVYAAAVPEIVTIRLRLRKGSPWASHDKQRTSQKKRQEEKMEGG
ncbi:unnamed protein product, partial [Heterotrigona itama]